MIKGKKVDDIVDMAEEELTRIAGKKRVVSLFGRAEVKEEFKASKKKKAGRCVVTYLTINPLINVRIMREDRLLFFGEISSLARNQDHFDVSEGESCWVTLENFNDIKVGDMIESY